MNPFDKLPNDIILYIALDMDIPEVFNYCRLSKRFNGLVCNSQNFWTQRLQRDFKIFHVPVSHSPKSYYLEIKESLLRSGNHINIRFDTAAQYGMLWLVKDIYKNKNIVPSLSNAIILSSTNGHLDTVKFLVEEAGFNIVAQLNEGLIRASTSNNLELVKYLIEKGADLNYYNNYIGSPVTLAASSGNVDILKYLIQLGANVGESIIYSPAKKGNLNMVKYLVETIGIGPNSDAVRGAIEGGQVDILKYLVSKGAKIYPYQVKYNYRYPEMNEYLGRIG